MRLAVVALVCALLTGSVRDPQPEPPSVVVWPEYQCDDGWGLYLEVNGLPVTAWLRDETEARRLYSVLCAVMRGGEFQ